MKWLRTLVLFDNGGVGQSVDWSALHDSYVRAIGGVEHPAGSGMLTLRRRQGAYRNGVKPLRTQFLERMVRQERWSPEGPVNISGGVSPSPIFSYPGNQVYSEPVTSEFGAFDFITSTSTGFRIAIEWETGNISSSHRSMNKLAIALASGVLEAGVLIVPSRGLYQHLTDRIGNIGELSPYLPMWSGLSSSVKRGLLAITVVEHDELSDSVDVPYLERGRDGNAIT